MTKDQEDMSVLFKHKPATNNGGGETNNQVWRLAQPNLDHKPLTQDQIREESMKYLNADQRRHFELNIQLNRRGSLFGPKRDQRREKTPPYAKSIDNDADTDFANTILVPQTSAVSLVGGRDPRSVASMASVATTRFPTTYASVRGSDVADDMRLLGSMMPSMSFQNVSMLGNTGIASQSHMSMRGRSPELEKASLFRIDDWIKMEQKGEYLGKRKHFLRVVNTLDYDEKVMQVSNYQMLHELVDFYARNYNSNAHNYVWKDIWGNTLHMYKCLGENGLMDNSLIIDELGLDHFPTILIYFKDGFENEPLMRLDISKPEPDGITVPCRNY